MISRGRVPIIHAIGWFQGGFGYNVHTRGLFDALARKIPTIATPIWAGSGPVDEDREVLDRVLGDRIGASICLMPGRLCDYLDDAFGQKIAYIVWEGTKLPRDWIEPLSRADRIWIPTAWGKRVLIENGFSADRIDVVPEGVDTRTFNPDGPKAAFFTQAEKKFRFLFVGRYEKRKAAAELIQAFDQEFNESEEVELVLGGLKANRADLDLGQELRSLHIRYPRRLKIIPHIHTHEEFASLYRSVDMFVFPTRAEGWGLPVIEAMATGLPVIVTGYSGVTEFIGNHVWRVDHRMIKIDDPYYQPDNQDFGDWAEPDFGHLRQLMRQAYELRDSSTLREMGREASVHIARNFTWEKAADCALRRLRDCGAI